MAWNKPDLPPWLLLALGWAGSAVGTPAVIHDQGPTRPLADYVAMPAPRAAGPARQAGPFQSLGPRFPVRTPRLSPGQVAPRAVNLPQLAGRPMFLIGSDSFSRAWLARYRDRLRAAGAVGILVQADTAEEFETMKTLAQGLPITAVPAPRLVESLNLAHYPVLVSAGRIEQ